METCNEALPLWKAPCPSSPRDHAEMANSLNVCSTEQFLQLTWHLPKLGKHWVTQYGHCDASQQTACVPSPVSCGQMVFQTVQGNWCLQLWYTWRRHNWGVNNEKYIKVQVKPDWWYLLASQSHAQARETVPMKTKTVLYLSSWLIRTTLWGTCFTRFLYK